jgi:hypothetical protein
MAETERKFEEKLKSMEEAAHNSKCELEQVIA